MDPAQPSDVEPAAAPAPTSDPAAPGQAQRSVAADAAASVGVRILAMVLSSITGILVLAALDQHEYGAYALAAGLVGVLAVALDAGTTSSLARFVAQGRGSVPLVGRVLGLRIAVVLAGAAVLSVIGILGAWDDGFGELLLPAAPLLVGLGAVSVMYGALPSMRRIRLLLLITILQPAIELAVVAVVLLRDGPPGAVLLGSAGAAILAAVVGYVALALRPTRMLPSVPASGPLATLGDVLHYGRQLFLVLLLMMVFGQIDQFVIQAFHGEADVAPYALAMKLQALLIAPAVAATGIVAPRIAGAGAAAHAMYRRWLAAFVILYTGGTLVFAVLARDVVTAINPVYRDDWGVLVALLPFIFLFAVVTLPSVTLNQTGHAASRLRMACITLAVNAVLDLVLVPVLGAYGAAIGTTCAIAYYAWAHHRRLEVALSAGAPTPDTGTRRLLLLGGISALGVALLAVLLRPLVEVLTSADGRAEAVAIVLVAAGIPALIHVALTVRLVRRTGQ